MTARKLILPFVAASLLLPACNPVDNPDDPNGSGGGNPVVFTVGSRGSTTTKTSYSGTGTTSQGKLKERIDWEVDDSLTVSCLKTTPTSATYVIKGDINPASGDASRSQAKKIEPVQTGTFPNGTPKTSGLQWGEGTHRFYAVYPEVKSSNPKDIMSLTITKVDNTDKGEISAKIPATQTYYRDSIIAGTSIRHLVPSHRFPYMWAATQADEKANFSLSFSPMVTAFQFTVGGDGTVTEEITITGFELESSTCALAGADAYVTLVTDASTAGTFTASYSTYVDLVTEGANKNNSVTFTMPSGTNAPKISSTKQLRFMVFVYPFGKSTTRNVLDGLKVKFSTSVGGRALDLKYSDTAASANAGKWVEFPAGCKINISNLQLPQQLAPWTYSVTVGNWDEELPDVVVSPVKVTEFEIEDITMQDDSQYILEGTVPNELRVPYTYAGGDETLATGFRSCLGARSYLESEPFIFQYSETGAEGTWTDGLPDWLSVPSTEDQSGYTTATALKLHISAGERDKPGRTYVRVQQPASGEVSDACLVIRESRPLTIEPKNGSTTITIPNPWGHTYRYSINGGAVQTDNGNPVSITAGKGQPVALYQDQVTELNPTADHKGIVFSDDCYVYGDVMSLGGFSDSCVDLQYARLFLRNEKLLSHTDTDNKPLVLSATKVAESCYHSMFTECSSLVTAPAVLPATTLALECYDAMFFQCTSLVKAPDLPATTLARHCYRFMFWGCISLEIAPVLPAETPADECYDGMFEDCNSLKEVKCHLTVTGDSYTYHWLFNVPNNASCTFYKKAGATWSRDENGIPSNWTVVEMQ